MRSSEREKAVRFIFYNTEYFEGIEGEKWKYLEFWRRFFGTKKILLKMCWELSKYKPDVLAFVEMQTRSFFGGGRYDRVIKRELGMRYSLMRSKYSFNGIGRILGFVPGMKGQSNAFFSKRKLYDSEFVYFKEGVKRMVIRTSVNFPKRVTFFVVHLALSRDVRRKQMKELVEMINKVKTPVVVAGDFNSFDGADELKGLIKNTRLRKAKESFTYPAFHPNKILDHILVTSEVKIKKCEALKLKSSDHLPIMVDFEVR